MSIATVNFDRQLHGNALMEPFTALFDLDSLEENELGIAAQTMAVKPWYDPDAPTDDRLKRAIGLLRAGRVRPGTHTGVFQVHGKDDTYTVSVASGCTCPYATEKRAVCYHFVATKLYKEWEHRLVTRGLQVPRAPDTEEAPMPSRAEKRRATQAMLDRESPAPPVPPEETAMLPTSVVPACRSITEIIADLSQPLPAGCVATKTQGGAPIDYIHWHTAVRLLDQYAPGWRGEVVRLEHVAGHVVQVYRITIPCAEGEVWREATGCEKENLKGYGDVFSNSEAMALKRAAAKFGLALDLYDKDETGEALDRHLEGGREQKAVLLRTLGERLDAAQIDRAKFIAQLKTQTHVSKNADLPVPVLQAAVALVEVLAADATAA